MIYFFNTRLLINGGFDCENEALQKRTNLKKSERKIEQKTKNSNENNKVEFALSLDKKRTARRTHTRQ